MVATLILVAVVIVVVLRSRGHTGEDKRLPKNNGMSKPPPADHENLVTVPLKKLIDDIDVDDKNPDVVPHSSGTYVCISILHCGSEMFPVPTNKIIPASC